MLVLVLVYVIMKFLLIMLEMVYPRCIKLLLTMLVLVKVYEILLVLVKVYEIVADVG